MTGLIQTHGVDFLQFRGTEIQSGPNSLRGTKLPAKAFETFARRSEKSDVSGTSVGDTFSDAETGPRHSVWNQSQRTEVKIYTSIEVSDPVLSKSWNSFRR